MSNNLKILSKYRDIYIHIYVSEYIICTEYDFEVKLSVNKKYYI